jgi:hypothetical protein
MKKQGGGAILNKEANVRNQSVATMSLLAVSAVLFSCLAPPAQAERPPDLAENLAFLEPLLAHGWTGGFVGENAPDLEITLHYEAMVEGMAVRYTRVAKDADYNAEMFFYWDPSDKIVRFLMFDNKGNVAKGTVDAKGSRFVLNGESHRSDRIVEYKNVFEVLADGRLRDTYTPVNLGPEAHGHVQEFGPVKPSD